MAAGANTEQQQKGFTMNRDDLREILQDGTYGDEPWRYVEGEPVIALADALGIVLEFDGLTPAARWWTVHSVGHCAQISRRRLAWILARELDGFASCSALYRWQDAGQPNAATYAQRLHEKECERAARAALKLATCAG